MTVDKVALIGFHTNEYPEGKHEWMFDDNFVNFVISIH